MRERVYACTCNSRIDFRIINSRRKEPIGAHHPPALLTISRSTRDRSLPLLLHATLYTTCKPEHDTLPLLGRHLTQTHFQSTIVPHKAPKALASSSLGHVLTTTVPDHSRPSLRAHLQPQLYIVNVHHNVGIGAPPCRNRRSTSLRFYVCRRFDSNEYARRVEPVEQRRRNLRRLTW
jgi:hypothetical protein